MEFLAFGAVNDDQFDQNRWFRSPRSGGVTIDPFDVPGPRFACSSIVDDGWMIVFWLHSSPCFEWQIGNTRSAMKFISYRSFLDPTWSPFRLVEMRIAPCKQWFLVGVATTQSERLQPRPNPVG
ncbi:MAG: hypothetical protein HKP61_07525 [Dactylosporangium sp.]|nr:hypothetical protein [Dactylosporangium sp.]